MVYLTLLLSFSGFINPDQSPADSLPRDPHTDRVAIIDSIKVSPEHPDYWTLGIINTWTDRTAYASLKKSLYWMPAGIDFGFYRPGER